MAKKNEVKNNVLVFENVIKTFSNYNTVLDGVSFNVQEGEVVALVGKNGVGKSLLINILLGLVPKTSGDIYLNLGGSNWNENLNRIGVQYQDNQFTGRTKVGKLIKFYLKFYKVNINDNDIKEMFDKFQIRDIESKYLVNLSGGEKQRLNLFLSLLNNPKLLILDEFITGLDIIMVSSIIEYLIELKEKKNLTLLIISHNHEEIELLATKIVLMKEGKVDRVATPYEIIDEYSSIKNFLKSEVS